ncbi:MFS transporter, sugar porter (SP) family [Terribacillus aidingensis]|uniref:MFS transporter, sugar porter (SP) family n=1 Tax=Terribacillus aidingensis TaxID=586416 RepID=A0A285P724_9BACI|nr:sugar porter family MFS transporter [Terribacillus aidingensis]SNZ17067.1 MFS transporter, sugar porter (SP) family [Terribacillus aidingensis]
MQKKQSNSLLYFFGALGGLLYGYDTGVISGALLYIDEDLGLNSFTEGLIVSSLLVGAIISAAITGRVTDKIGRKKTIITAGILFFIGALGAAVAVNVTTMVIARVILGLAVGASTTIVPLYLSELAPKEKRGSLASLNQLLITIGILSSYLVNYAFSDAGAWRWMLGLAVVPAVILIIGMFFMPESPRWLLTAGKEDKARNILKKVRGENASIEDEISEIQKAEKEDEGGIKELFSSWVRPALIAGLGLAFLQQFIGINTIIYYAPSTFTSAGFGNSAAILGTVGIGTVNVLMTLIAIKIVDKVNRKTLLMAGNIGMVVSLIALSTINLLAPDSIVATWAIIICLGLFIVAFSTTWGPVVWIMLPELFPTKVRGIGTGAATFALHGANLIVSLLFPILLEAIGISYLFYIFAVIGIFAFLFVKFFTTETRGKSLEQIEEDLRKRSIG